MASLPMYDLPEVRDAHAALWSALARALRASGVGDVADALTHEGTPEEHWSDPALLFSQSCGYPITHAFAGRLRVIATPRYTAAGCVGAQYASAIVVRAGDGARGLADLRGRAWAINERASHSGMSVLRAMVARLTSSDAPFFAREIVTGSNVASLAAVRRGDADVASIDAVTYGLLARHRREALAGTRVLVMSPRAPALPYVTRAAAPDALVASLRDALTTVLADDAMRDAREALLLAGIEVLPDDAYDVVRRMAAASL